MHGDFSKWPIDVANIVGPLQQQGRVLLDTQQNAATSAVRRWQDETARAAFGRYIAAVPTWERDAFKIERAEIKPDSGGINQVFVTVDPGLVWADGILAQLIADAGATTASRVATYLTPPLEPVPTDPGANGTRDAVVLEVWRAALSGFQDANLLEPALGGPDTYELMQTRMAFRLFRMGPNDTCETIRDRIQDDFSTRGKLTVTLAPTTVTPGDCPVVQGGGYSGFEHDLYRVEIAELPAGQPVMFKWSQFNGGLVGTGIFDAAAAPPTVTVIGNKSAISTSGLSDCYLEAFDFDPQLGNWKLVYAAPATLGNDDLISLKPATFGAVPGGNQPRFFRLWNQLRPITDFPSAANPPVELRDGIRLQFDVAGNTPVNYVAGDYWTFPVRAGGLDNPQTLINARPPEGVHHHRAPLAELHWTGGGPITAPAQIDDCRIPFHPLTANDCCCTFTVGDGIHSEGDFLHIQDAINALPPQKGGRVCVLPGEHTANVTLQDLQNVILTGCGPQTVVRSAAPSGNALTADPVIHVLGGTHIRIEHMTIMADDTGIGVLLEDDPGSQTSSAMRLIDATVQFLDVRAAAASGIEMRSGVAVRIRDCNVVMKDVETMWPGIMVHGSDITIERNRVGVVVGELRITASVNNNAANNVTEMFTDAGLSSAGNAASASAGLGGIWLRGGCSAVRVLGNLVQGGIGNGITLGSADVILLQDTRPGLVGWFYGNADQCGACEPGGTYVPPTSGTPGGLIYIAGPPLNDIVIEGNSILNMGMNGIGVFAFFGDPAAQGVITVRLLRIADNQIIHCLLRQLAPTPDQAQGYVGYGGIALADVEDATISSNLITDNGRDYLQPVCGIFLFHAVDVDITDNQIAQNGRKTDQNPNGARPGPRGGIWATLASERIETVLVGDRQRTAPAGLPAIRVHNNRVEAPLGRALTVEVALGPVSVVGNRLCTRGVSTTWDSLYSSTVWILDIAIDRELALTNNMSLVGASTGVTTISVGGTAPTAALSSDGNVMFADNQVALEVLEDQRFLPFSILIITLDDLSFTGNQCDCFFGGSGAVISHLLATGISMRCEGNRLKEGLAQALLSAINFAFLGDITTGNISTHCMLVRPSAPLGIKNSNVELMGLLSRGSCEKINGAAFSTGFNGPGVP